MTPLPLPQRKGTEQHPAFHEATQEVTQVTPGPLPQSKGKEHHSTGPRATPHLSHRALHLWSPHSVKL